MDLEYQLFNTTKWNFTLCTDWEFLSPTWRLWRVAVCLRYWHAHYAVWLTCVFKKFVTWIKGTLMTSLQYTKLCAFSQALKPWFIAHWCLFGGNCLALFAFDSTHFSLLSRQLSRAPAVFMVIAFVLNFTFLLIPCVYASRVTWKCQDLLSKINNMGSGDWPKEGHPFRELANVNEFIFYAERSMCGFKVGSITFGSSGTWFSVFLGLLGLGVRLLGYIK